MPEKLKLGTPDGADVVEVELFDETNTFTLKPITRSVQKVLEKVDDDVTAATDGDSVVAAVADGLGALLAPSNGNKAGAKKLILEKWKADELSVQQIMRFFEELQETSVPPT